MNSSDPHMSDIVNLSHTLHCFFFLFFFGVITPPSAGNLSQQDSSELQDSSEYSSRYKKLCGRYCFNTFSYSYSFKTKYAGVLEYTYCVSNEGSDPPTNYLDMTLNNLMMKPQL